MSLMYRGLRRVLQVAVELFYVDIRLAGAERVPSDGPVIFAANHPNSIMDSVILGTQIDRQIHYLAKSELFKNPLVAWIFDQCGVIPLHRNPDQKADNEAAFRSAFELLEGGGCLGIFPEGRNSLERGVLEIKTGTARIALGAERRNDYELDVRVVPVGLNFENRDRFMTRVVARVGESIPAAEFGGAHREDERAAVRAMTDEIQQSLRRIVADLEDERVRRLAEEVHRVYGRELLENMLEHRDRQVESAGESAFDDRRVVEELARSRGRAGRGIRRRLIDGVKQKGASGDAEEFDRQLWVKDRIAAAIRYYGEHEPELFRELEIRLQQYVDHLDQYEVRGDLAERLPELLSAKRDSIKLTAYAVVFAAPAIWGFVNNVVPYNVTRLAALKAPDEPMRAFTGLVVGTIVFGILYSLQTWLVWSLSSGSLLVLGAYLVSVPLAGFFFLRYRRQVSKYRDRILVRTLFRTRRNLVDALLAERDILIDIFDTLRDHFRAVEEARETGESLPELPEVDLSPLTGTVFDPAKRNAD